MSFSESPGTSTTGPVAVAPTMPSVPTNSATVAAAQATEKPAPTVATLPPLSEMMGDMSGFSPRSSFAPQRHPATQDRSLPPQTPFLGRPSPHVIPNASRYELPSTTHPAETSPRPSSAYHGFYSLLDPHRAHDASPRAQAATSLQPRERRSQEPSSALPFWTSVVGTVGGSDLTLTPSPSLVPGRNEHDLADEIGSPRPSTSSSRKRVASTSDSPPGFSFAEAPKHRRTHSQRPVNNAPPDAWLRPAPPRICNTTKWTVDRVQGYKEGYSDAMDAVKRGQIGWDNKSYCNFVFWRHSPAMVAAEILSDDVGLDDDDVSPYSEDHPPSWTQDEKSSPRVNPVDTQRHRTSGDRPSSHTEHTRRQAISCWPCRKRKLKCDGQHPCSTCTRRPAEQGCVYEQEVKRRGKGRKGLQDGSFAQEGDQLEHDLSCDSKSLVGE